MELPHIPINVCKLQERNETKIEETFQEIHQQFMEVQQESDSLRLEVNKLNHEAALLEKEEYCLKSKNTILEEEIASLKQQTEEVASTVESLKWKMYKINLIKEFEQKSNGLAYMEIHREKGCLDTTSVDTAKISNKSVGKTSTFARNEIEAKIAKLKEEIEKEKREIEMTDPKLITNMKILEKRNAALLLRYQRQIGEATRRFRQTQAEVSSLKRILAEKEALLANTSDAD